MSDKPESLWKGRPLSELSRQELIEALEEMGQTMWEATLRRQAEDALLDAFRARRSLNWKPGMADGH